MLYYYLLYYSYGFLYTYDDIYYIIVCLHSFQLAKRQNQNATWHESRRGAAWRGAAWLPNYERQPSDRPIEK